jgi:large-conductance mechanosensitive channel
VHHRAKLAAFLDADEVVEHHVHGFANFLREFGVVGLAVGFVAGTQVNGVVKQLLESFFTPLFTLFFGKSLQSRTVTVGWHGRHEQLAWGAAVFSLLSLIIILIVVYATIKVFKLDRFKKSEIK